MLSSRNRLPSIDIPTTLRTGIRIRGEAIDFTYAQKTGSRREEPRFAVIVSSKIDKRAVARNRMKRLVREAVQDLLPTIQMNVSGVFVVRRRLPDTAAAVLILVRQILDQKHLWKEVSE